MMTRMLRTHSDPEDEEAKDDHNRNSCWPPYTITITDQVAGSSTDDEYCGGGSGGGSGCGFDGDGINEVETTSTFHESIINANERGEREERSKALERTYVHDVYEQMADHQKENRSRPWIKVKQFLLELEPGSLVCDVGCGNGKYLDINCNAYALGSDRCAKIVGMAAKQSGHHLVVCDNAALPFREESFDAVLSIAVVHHFATTERRVQALHELARLLRIGGRLMITVWAIEQRHRKFESQDVLVPWHRPICSNNEDHECTRKFVGATTSEDDLLNHRLDSEPYAIPQKQKSVDVPKIRNRHRRSQSSLSSNSDLTSPSNETCYSFVRRALQKWSNTTRSWSADERSQTPPSHHRSQGCRPSWFPSMNSEDQRNITKKIGEKQDSEESNENENANDIPIELHGVDSGEMCHDFLNRSITPTTINPACLKTNKSSLETTSTMMRRRHKSKSLSDILTSLFAVNFLSSSLSSLRKSSQDSTTSGSSNNTYSTASSTSLARKSSSSSNDSRKSNRVTRCGSGSHVHRSKSGHFTLAKVDEGNELPQQPTTPPDKRPSLFTVNDAINIDEISETSSRILGSKSSPTRKLRPRSLVLPSKAMRIPRTLSAEDHRNGNTILPDLDTSCLSFYGMSVSSGVGDRHSCPSPPYMKTDSTEQCPGHNQYQKKDDTNPTCQSSKLFKDIPTHNFDFDRKVSHNDKAMPVFSIDHHHHHHHHQQHQSERRITLNDIHQENFINRIIVNEHLFPYYSMPNLITSRTTDNSVTQRRTTSIQKQSNHPTLIFDDEDIIIRAINPRPTRNISLPGGSSSFGRRRSSRRNIRHSFSCGDNCIKSATAAFDLGHRLGRHIYRKEDSLQSDTSVDSDDSVASVIAVQQQHQLQLQHQERRSTAPSILNNPIINNMVIDQSTPTPRSERLSSTCSKDSSNHSDTSVDSEESCISVIAAPVKNDGIDVDGIETEQMVVDLIDFEESHHSVSVEYFDCPIMAEVCWLDPSSSDIDEDIQKDKSVDLKTDSCETSSLVTSRNLSSETADHTNEGENALIEDCKDVKNIVTDGTAKSESIPSVWMTTEMNSIYRWNSTSEAMITKRRSRDVAVETDPTSDTDELGTNYRDIRVVHEDVINGNVPGQKNMHECWTNSDAQSSKNHRRYSESYVNTSKSLTSSIANKRLSFGGSYNNFDGVTDQRSSSNESKTDHQKVDQKMSVSSTTMTTTTTTGSSIDNHLGSFELVTADQLINYETIKLDSKLDDKKEPTVISLSTSDDSILSGSDDNGGDDGATATFHRYYHVFREGELDRLIENYVDSLHIISSYYDHTSWCIIAEKVHVWRI